MSPHRIATSRRSIQALLLAVIMLLPFLSINDNPALRMDLGQRTLFLAGAAIRIDQFYLVLLSTLLLVAVFLLLTVVLGRVWCGWLCPQTVLNDLAELLTDRLRVFLSKRTATLASHFIALMLAVAVSINLLCLFMPPVEVLKSVFSFSCHPVMMLCLSATIIVMYLDLLLVKRSFCRSYCPYGRFQAALLDAGTLSLGFCGDARDRCIRCDSCVRACPMGIDIRQGLQIECINCGRCIDACRGVMERMSGTGGLIAYRFGEGIGNGARVGVKTVMLAILLGILTGALVWGLNTRSDTAFSVQKLATVETRIFPDGSQVQAWRAIIGNRGASPAVFSMGISPQAGLKSELLGPVTAIRIAPNENRQVSFFIRFNGSTPLRQPFELLLLKAGMPVATIQVTP